jgi:hypothetical protein
MKSTLIISLLLILSAATAYAKEGVIFARFHKGQSDLYFVGLDGKGLTSSPKGPRNTRTSIR